MGEDEVAKGIYSVKSLNQGVQTEVPCDQLVEKVSALIAENPILLSKDK